MGGKGAGTEVVEVELLDELLGLLSGVLEEPLFSDEDRGWLTTRGGGVSLACLADGDEADSSSSDRDRLGLLWLLLVVAPIIFDSIL